MSNKEPTKEELLLKVNALEQVVNNVGSFMLTFISIFIWCLIKYRMLKAIHLLLFTV